MDCLLKKFQVLAKLKNNDINLIDINLTIQNDTRNVKNSRNSIDENKNNSLMPSESCEHLIDSNNTNLITNNNNNEPIVIISKRKIGYSWKWLDGFFNP